MNHQRPVTNRTHAYRLLKAGDFAGAEQSARAALADGDSPGLLHLLGTLLCRRGAVDEGVEVLERALAGAPADAAIRIHLVRALIDSGRGDEALRVALPPAPGPAAARLWRARAEAAEAAGSLADQRFAERHAELAGTDEQLARGPDDRGLLIRRGRLLGALRRDDEAEVVYRSLIERDPKDGESIAELGLLYDRGNRLDDLASLLAGAEAAGADMDALAFLKAVDAWRRKAAVEAAAWLKSADFDRDPVRSFALQAKVADALGDHQAAATATIAKNAAVPDRDRWLSEGRAFCARMRAFAAAITPDWASRFSPMNIGERAPPVFLLGFPRSGTTLIDTFLMGHPGIKVLEEEPLMGFVADALGPLQRIAALDQSEVERLRGIYFQHLDRLVAPGFDGLVVDKMPINTLCAPLIHRLFPDARLIFAQRHPCDCVLSGLMQNFNMNPAMANFLDPEGAADFYDVTLDIWTRSTACLPLSVRTIVYEKLVADPEPVLRAMIDFLGLEWHGGLVDHRRAAAARGRISTASYDQVTEPLHRRSSGRWRQYQALLGPALPKLLPWVGRLGYER